MTFSLVARCAETGMFGLAISSSSPAVAARCAYARAGVGAVASQNVTDPLLGPLALDFMENGMSAVEAIELSASKVNSSNTVRFWSSTKRVRQRSTRVPTRLESGRKRRG